MGSGLGHGRILSELTSRRFECETRPIRGLSNESEQFQGKSAHRAPRGGRHDGPSLAGVRPGVGCTSRARSERAQAFPKRFAALFMGNGINPKHWSAKGAGNDMELSKSLEPMLPFRAKLNVISGLFNKHATGVGIHPGQTGNILSGAALQRGRGAQGGREHGPGAGRAPGRRDRCASLVLGCEQPITGYHETNFSMAYSSHISWQDALSPVPMEVYPSLAFDSLFDNQGSRRTQSILDRVKEQAVELKPAGQPGRSGESSTNISQACARSKSGPSARGQ